VPVPGFLVEEVAAMLASRRPATNSLLFASPEGTVLRNRNARRAWFDAAASAIGAGPDPHGLRHTASSLAVSSGASVLAVSCMLGHARPSITLDTYADLFDSDLDEVANRLDQMGPAAESVRVTDSKRIRSWPGLTE
jgi:integrase